MGCSSCTAAAVAAQTEKLAEVDKAIAQKFGPHLGSAVTTSRIEVLDAEKMGKRWGEVRLPTWRKQHPPPADPKEIGKYTNERKRVAALLEKAGESIKPLAFAYEGTVYVSPDLDERTLTHEALHLRRHPNALEWTFKNSDLETTNRFDESLTEYFNRQLTPGISEPGDKYHTDFDYSHYGAGSDVIRQLRDERLGGPIEGEQRLRRFFFAGDTAALTGPNESAKSFFDDYNARLSTTTVKNIDAREAAERAARQAELTP